MDAFSARLNAVEGSYFRAEQTDSTRKHLERMVEQGKLPSSSLPAINEHLSGGKSTFMGEEIPVTIIKSRPASEVVFNYNGIPVPRMSATESWARLGTTKVSLGRARWSADGASIFSVNDGKRLAQTPVKEPTAWELNRQRKIAKAAVDDRVVRGMRLMPEYTPARAMLWGSILALWATGAVTASVARSLDIHSSEEASGKIREAMHPVVESASEALQPLKAWFTAQDTQGMQSSFLPVQELSKRMREKLGHQQHT